MRTTVVKLGDEAGRSAGLDWGDLWRLRNGVTPPEAHELGRMVAAMAHACLAEITQNAVQANVAAFRRGLLEGMAEHGLDAAQLFADASPPSPPPDAHSPQS